jgi:hypothetical protein
MCAGGTPDQEPKLLSFDLLGDMAIGTWHTAAQEYDVIITTCCGISQSPLAIAC